MSNHIQRCSHLQGFIYISLNIYLITSILKFRKRLDSRKNHLLWGVIHSQVTHVHSSTSHFLYTAYPENMIKIILIQDRNSSTVAGVSSTKRSSDCAVKGGWNKCRYDNKFYTANQKRDRFKQPPWVSLNFKFYFNRRLRHSLMIASCAKLE